MVGIEGVIKAYQPRIMSGKISEEKKMRRENDKERGRRRRRRKD